ncbi:MAG TPA: lactate dehydrogenase, partial [Bacteroidales bacterium]|nr:lactate dehydrogenase [Bacteroidales bacterium]
MSQKFIPFNIIEDFMVKVLVKAGIPENDSKIVTDVLVQADKLGFDSHGVNRLKPIYLDRIKDGILNPVTNFRVVKDGPTTAVIDGQNGMGHVIASNAMKMAIEKAKR